MFNVQLDTEQYEIVIDYIYFIFFGMLILTNINSFAKKFFKSLRIIFKYHIGHFMSSDFLLIVAVQIVGVT